MLDPGVDFNAQISNAARKMPDDDASAFKGCQEAFSKAKKDKLNSVREAAKAMTNSKIEHDAAEHAERNRLMDVASGKFKKLSA